MLYGRELQWIAASKHFGRQNIGRLAALRSKMARIKLLVDWLQTAQSFVLYGILISLIWPCIKIIKINRKFILKVRVA